MLKILVPLLSILLPLTSFAKSVDFSLPTKDGLSHISGQIDRPETGKKNYPTVFIIGGTGLFYRNGYFGRSGTERDYIFSDLSKRFVAAGFVVVRFDYRGVSCDLVDQAAILKCLDQNIRGRVSDETILDDIQVVYDHVLAQAFVNQKKIFVLGHSEGSLNISRLVALGRLQPAGILFIGGVVESAKSMVHWQIVDRSVDWAFEMDENNNGILTNGEITTQFAKSKFHGNFPLTNFLSPIGYWTKEGLTATLELGFDQLTRVSLAQSDDAIYLSNGLVFSSYKWWKRWLQDDTSVLANLSAFEGPIKYHNGDIDSLTPGRREKLALDSTKISMKSKPLFELHLGKGHGLGSDMFYGPVDESIANEIVSDIQAWASRKEQVPPRL